MFTLIIFHAVLACVCAAPPPGSSESIRSASLYASHPPPPGLEYFLGVDRQLLGQYSAPLQKEGGSGSERLETLEPDSEVELLPGAQQPIPQRPVSPASPGGQPGLLPGQLPGTQPGLLPGQHVYIVHMLPGGYRPGVPTAGYQPVYIVGAAPAHGHYAASGLPGYQNTILVDTSGQVRGGAPAHGVHGLAYPSPIDFLYTPETLTYQGHPEQGAVRLAQLVSLQNVAPVHAHQNSPKANSRLVDNGAGEQDRSSPAAVSGARSPRPSRPVRLLQTDSPAPSPPSKA